MRGILGGYFAVCSFNRRGVGVYPEENLLVSFINFANVLMITFCFSEGKAPPPITVLTSKVGTSSFISLCLKIALSFVNFVQDIR